MTTSLNKQFPAARRPLILTEDDDGAKIVQVHLAGGDFAKVFADDFTKLMALGLSPNWFLNDNGGDRVYVRTHMPLEKGWTGNIITVARFIRPVPLRGLIVRHLDGRPLNLRRDNLFVSERRSRAKAREWSIVNGQCIALSA